MKLQWLGNAGVIIEEGSSCIGFDPFVELENGENRNRAEDFAGVTDIFITHGHYDHIFSLPQVQAVNPARVHCGARAAKNIGRLKRDVGMGQGDGVIAPNIVSGGHGVTVGELTVTVYKSRHVHFDMGSVGNALSQSFRPKRFRKALGICRYALMLPEKGETFAYCIEASGKRALLLGSCGLDDTTEYPPDIDALILAYQGNSRIAQLGMRVVERLQPKKVILDHFDDAFPPISGHVNTDEFVECMRIRNPDISVIVPKFRETIDI